MRRSVLSCGFMLLAGAMAFGQSSTASSIDVSQDKKDIRHDRRDVRGDRRDRKGDLREVRKDQKDINHDRRDLNKDRAEIARDKRTGNSAELAKIGLTRVMTDGISVTTAPTATLT